MGLDSIVNVQISRQTAGVTQAGFGVPLILGPNAAFPQTEIREYRSLNAVAEDFTSGQAEYVMASKIFSQTPRPPRLKIGKTSAPVAQVSTLTPDVTVQAIAQFVATIDGEVYSFTSDATPTAGEVVTGLIALINGDPDAKVTASGTTTLILTADVPGNAFTVETSANLSVAATTPSNGIANDIQKASDVDADWYFLLLTSVDVNTIIAAASDIEARKKLMLFLTSDVAVPTAVTTDIVSVLKAKTLFRTAAMYSGTAADRAESALVGRVAPLDPGSETWANKTLANVTVDKLTDGQQANLSNKNANFYVQIAGINVTQNGKVVGGEYIDVIRFIDWLTARMQEAVFTQLVQQDKVPYTDAGIAVVETAMRAVLEAGVRAGGIPSSQDYTVTVPKAKDISQADKAARHLTGITFTATLSGAIHAVTIQGTVTL